MDDLLWLWASPKLNELAEANFKRFVAVLFHLIVEEQVSFDLQIAAGNTGLVMARYTQMVYRHLRKAHPPLLRLAPIWTPPDGEKQPVGSSLLACDLANQVRDANLDDGRALNRVLFVDDEIAGGITVRESMRLLGVALGKQEFTLDIVAEDQGFELGQFPPQIHPRFIPFSKGIKGFFNIALYWLPYEVDKPMTSRFSDGVMPISIRHTVLLDLPARNKTVPLSGYTYQMNQIAMEKIPELERVKTMLMEFVGKLIEGGIKGYQSGSINLSDDSYRERIIFSTP